MAIGEYEPLPKNVTMPFNQNQMIRQVLNEVAPLYEAEKVLKEWLHANGIAYGTDGYSYRCLDMRTSTRGAPIPDRFTTYAEMLTFALQYVKDNIVREAIEDMELAQTLTEYKQDG